MDRTAPSLEFVRLCERIQEYVRKLTDQGQQEHCAELLKQHQKVSGGSHSAQYHKKHPRVSESWVIPGKWLKFIHMHI